jgi:cobalamin synthase
MSMVVGSMAARARAGALSSSVAVATSLPMRSRIRTAPVGSVVTAPPAVGSLLGVAASAVEVGGDRSAGSEPHAASDAARTGTATPRWAR